MNEPPDATQESPRRFRFEPWHFWSLIVILGLCFAAVLVVQAFDRFARATSRVDEARRTLASIDAVLQIHQDAEIGQRGYVITEDASFLEPYEYAVTHVDNVIDDVAGQLDGQPDQIASLERVKLLSSDKLREVAKAVEMVRTGERDQAVALVKSGVGKRLMDEIRAATQSMRDRAETALADRTKAVEAARIATNSLAGIAFIASAMMVAIAWVVQRQSMRRQTQLLSEGERRRTAEADRRESEEKFRVIADTMPQIVWSTKPDGYHDYFNERWYEYTGMPRPHEPGGEHDPGGKGQGWSWSDYLHPDDIEPSKTIWTHSLKTGAPYYVEYRFRRNDGAYRWFIGRALPLRDQSGQITRWFGTCTDIEDQKRALTERETLLAAERAARSQAERAARMKDEFVATLSHELRTPLNAILGWTHLLRRDRGEQNVAKAIEVIERNTRVQTQMVEDLLDTSRILSGKLRLDVQRMDVLPVLEAAIDSVRVAAEAKGVRIVTVFGSGGAIQGDSSRVQQIVWNLLTNAIKFTPKSGKIQVTHRKSGSHVEIAVADSGQGIKPQFLPHVFERFRQEDASTTRRTGGLGLGLSIVKHLVEMHGGLVEAYSEGEGKGATFTVRLPLAAVRLVEHDAAAELPGIEPDESILEALRVLVLDDEPDARDLVKRVLEDAGALVASVGSAHEALALVQSGFVPEVVVSDIGMPEQDGYDFIRRFRLLGDIGAAPAAALTALARTEDRKRALLAGFQTHIAKPVDPVELVTVVASLSGRLGGPRHL